MIIFLKRNNCSLFRIKKNWDRKNWSKDIEHEQFHKLIKLIFDKSTTKDNDIK